ncbi:hypothetical protein [Novosphingobium endophyticum]|uniref:hypothetical protein n=1 Tax=Novosphingobium endophyticum TaxID=1955250 RepID=UPI00166C97A9|nr:hypothetical protein [Novosphingobium endophyticum]
MRWVLPQAMYPNLRQRAQDLLGIPLTWPAVMGALGKWNGLELEAAGEEAGIVMPMVRSLPEFLEERQYKEVLADAPLIEISKIGGSAREPLRERGELPLSGYRALGMGHVIAGAGLGRSLALHWYRRAQPLAAGRGRTGNDLRLGECRAPFGMARSPCGPGAARTGAFGFGRDRGQTRTVARVVRIERPRFRPDRMIGRIRLLNCRSATASSPRCRTRR